MTRYRIITQGKCKFGRDWFQAQRKTIFGWLDVGGTYETSVEECETSLRRQLGRDKGEVVKELRI